MASHFGQVNTVRFLLEQGADVEKCTSIGYTPLHQAAQQGHATIVQLLLDNSASPNAQTSVRINLKNIYYNFAFNPCCNKKSYLPFQFLSTARADSSLHCPETRLH